MKRNTARIIDRTVTLAATLCLAGNAYSVPSSGFWSIVHEEHPYALIVLLVIVGVFGALSPFESWSAKTLMNRNVTMRKRVLSSFGVLLDISKKIRPSLPTGDLALHIWQRRRTIRHPVSGVLVRVSTYRMGTTPYNRSFQPTKGVGVVGLCWEKDREFGFDVESLRNAITDEQSFDRHVRQHGRESVMNLGWQAFENVRHRGAVLAIPIRNGRHRFVGCVSVDASHGYRELDTHELREEVGKLALAIGQEEFECT